jgi:DNA-binding NarL/FixJ family response regulator
MADNTKSMTIDEDTQPPFTALERAVLQRLAAVRANAQTGQRLGRSGKTVPSRPARVYAKLGVVNWARPSRCICAWKLGHLGEFERNSHGREPMAFRDIHPAGTKSAIA